MQEKIDKILAILNLPETGDFIEVGAYDGETHSFTCGLADKGWTGIYVEPIKEYADKCKERHKNNKILVINRAVGQGEKEFNIGQELTTSNSEVLEVVNENKNWFGEPYINKKVKVKAVSLMMFQPPTLLVIDVEGSEFEALQECPLGKYVIIELHKDSPEWQSKQSIRENLKNCHEYLVSKGYTEIYYNDIDSVYENINHRA